MTGTLTVYADYVCPFCYLGRASLDAYREGRETPLNVTWHPFDLRGPKRGPDGALDGDADDGKDEAYFDRVRENVARLREEYDAREMLGIDETPTVDSFDAQVAALSVREADPAAWPAFHDGLFDALWVEGRDVGDPDVLAAVAREAGADPAAVRAAVDDEARRATLCDRFAAAREAGITGVPTFVSGAHAARGAVPPAHLRRLVAGE